MRTIFITMAAAVSALAVAAPAAAQWAPAPYGHAYGYQQNWGQVRSLHARIDNLQRRIERLDSRDRISEREARRLRDATRELEHRLRYAARDGLHPAEAQSLEYRLARLEQRLFRDARDGRRGDQWSHGGYYDRDRDGRDDRWERDRRRDRDDD